jgi:hypothetical protein
MSNDHDLPIPGQLVFLRQNLTSATGAVLPANPKSNEVNSMAATVVRMPVQVELAGRRLKRNKVFNVSNGSKKEEMTQVVDFWCQVLVMSVSEERTSRDRGPYRCVWVKLEDGVSGYVIFGENRELATKLRQGKVYNFEGFEIAGKSPMLKCHAVVTGKMTVSDTGQSAS